MKYLIIPLLWILCTKMSCAQVFYQTQKDNKIGLLDDGGKVFAPPIYDDFGEYAEGMMPAKILGKYGYLNSKGKMIIQPKYNYADKFVKGYAIVDLNGKSGLIDKMGRLLVPCMYDLIVVSDDGKIVVDKDGKTAVIDTKNNLLVPFKYDKIWRFHRNYAIAKVGDKSGLINHQGLTVLEPKYHYLNDFINGYSSGFSFDGKKMGLIDINGKVLLTPEYNFVFARQDGLVYLTKNNLQGLADQSGKILLPTEYTKVHQLQDGLLMIEKNNKYGFANPLGEIIIPIVYDEAGDFSEGLAPVLKGGFWTFIDKGGQTKIIGSYIGVMMGFNRGYAAFGKRDFSSGAHYTNDAWGLIDKNGKIVISNKYQSVGIPYKGYLTVEKDGRKYLVNMKEEIIADLKYEDRPVQLIEN